MDTRKPYDSALDQWVKDMELNDKLVTAFFQQVKHMESLRDVILYLREVLVDYKFKRVATSMFVSVAMDYETNRKKLTKERNGFFLARSVLIRYFEYCIDTRQKIILASSCIDCNAIVDTTVILDRFVTEQTPESFGIIFNHDFLIASEEDLILVHIDKKRKLRLQEREMATKSNISILEILISPSVTFRDAFDHEMPYKFHRKVHCAKCSSADDNGRTMETVQLKSDTKIVESSSETVDGLEVAKIQEKIKKKLDQPIRFGEYAGKSFLWLVGFKLSYVRKLLLEMDPEQELLDYFKEVVGLGAQIDFDGFPELIDMQRLIKDVEQVRAN